MDRSKASGEVAGPPLLAVEGLKTYFKTGHGLFKAVDGVSFTVERGRDARHRRRVRLRQDVTALSIMRLVPSRRAQSSAGAIRFEGTDLLGAQRGGDARRSAATTSR